MRYLGINYRDGIGADADEKQAEAWFRKAMDADDKEAPTLLFNMLNGGNYPLPR